RVGIAIRRLFFQAFEDYPIERRREDRILKAQRIRLPVDDAVDDLANRFAEKRLLAGNQFIEYHAETEYVRTMVEFAAEQLFGAHVMRRADEHPGLSQAAGKCGSVGQTVL